MKTLAALALLLAGPAVLAAEPQPKVEADGKAELFRTPRGKPKNLYTEGASPSGAIR